MADNANLAAITKALLGENGKAVYAAALTITIGAILGTLGLLPTPWPARVSDVKSAGYANIKRLPR